MMNRRKHLIFCSLLSLAACAGPSTPFGPSLGQGLQSEHGSREIASVSPPGLKWQVSPQKPPTEKATVLEIEIEDRRGISEEYSFKAFYNGVDLSSSFKLHSRAEVSPDRRQLKIRFPGFYLSPTEEHSILWAYRRNPTDTYQYYTYTGEPSDHQEPCALEDCEP